MGKVLFFIRLILLIISSIFFTIIGLLLIPLPFKLKGPLGKRIIQTWSWLSCKIYGIKIKIVGERKKIRPGTVIIANHTTYLDIFVLGSLFPAVFLSKREVLYMPIIGQGAWAVGILFVDRSSIRSGARSIRNVARALKKGATVITFPEATTTNEEKIRRFKVGGFQAAVMAKAPIQNLAVNYENFENVGWGDEDFLPNFLRNGSKWSHKVYIYFGEAFNKPGLKAQEVRELSFKEMERSFEVARQAKLKGETLH